MNEGEGDNAFTHPEERGVKRLRAQFAAKPGRGQQPEGTLSLTQSRGGDGGCFLASCGLFQVVGEEDWAQLDD